MKLSITRKLGFGFGVIVLAVLINLYLTNRTGHKYQDLNQKIVTVLNPSQNRLFQLADMVSTSKMLIKSWIYIDQINDTPDKLTLIDIHAARFPLLKDQLAELAAHWPEKDRNELQQICLAIQDSLFDGQEYIMGQLNDVSSYNDVFVIMEVTAMVDDYGEVSMLTNRLLSRINALETDFQRQTEEAQDQITSDFTSFQRLIILTNIGLIVIVLISALYSNVSIVRPLKKIDAHIGSLARGDLSKHLDIKQNDEIGVIATSVNILVDELRSTTRFADEIGKGHLDAGYQTLGEDDVLGNSLLEMRKSLQRAASEEEKRHKEDENRTWAAHGLAKFAEIMRHHHTDTGTLAQEVLSNLVHYVHANQGNLFIVNDTDPHYRFLEMRAYYAYDRNRFADKQVEIGEGLVGAVFQEGETVYMTDIPDNYVEITSGLGSKNPTAILIVPLKVNEQVYGVLELASFSGFEPYVREFIGKVSESIASAISSLKVNERTNSLLEQAKLQTQEMSEQEEELRQNIEEMQATQEEWQRKESGYKSFVEAINHGLPVIELSPGLVIRSVNENVLSKLDITDDLLLNRNYTDFLDSPADMDGKAYDRVWESLRSGNPQETRDKLNVSGKTYVFRQVFIPLGKQDKSDIDKILCITAEMQLLNS